MMEIHRQSGGFTPPAQLNVFDFLFNRGGMFTPLNLKDIQLGPFSIPLGLRKSKKRFPKSSTNPVLVELFYVYSGE